jgi:hypothetical protein
VLAAIAGASPHYVEDGYAVVLVLATTGTTYLAHVVAHLVGGAIGADRVRERARTETAADLRDALPILSSGSLPAAILLVAWLAALDPDVMVPLAAATVVLRLAGTGVLVARLSGLPPSGRQLWAGFVLAAVSVVIVVLKVTLTH